MIQWQDLTRQTVIHKYFQDPKKVSTVHNAVSPLSQEIQDIVPQKNPSEKVVTFLGRITMQKGPEYFVEAAAMVLHRTRNVRFVMAGSGDMMDQMIRLAFAQEAALWAQEWMAQSETPETPQEQERAERLLRRMRAQIDREERAARRRSRSVRLRRIVPRVVEIAACVVLAVAVATPFAIANVEFIRSAVMKLLIRIDWDEGVMQMNLVEDEGAAFNVPADWPGEYFPSYLPEGLEVTWKSYIPGYPCIEYTSESGERVINFSEMGENSTQVNGIEGAVISYMDINGQTAVVIETEHPENEADYYVGIAWDNGEKWFSVDTSGIPKEETIKIARSVKKILKN